MAFLVAIVVEIASQMLFVAITVKIGFTTNVKTTSKNMSMKFKAGK